MKQLMVLVILLIPSFSHQLTVKRIKDDELKAVVEFFNEQKGPLKIISFLCWRQDAVIKLIKEMHRNSRLIMNSNLDYRNEQQLPTTHTTHHQFYIADLDCNTSKKIMTIANNSGLFNYPHRWLILQGDTSENYGSYRFNLNSRIYIFQKGGTREIRVNSLYRIDGRENFLENNVGLWNGKEFDYFYHLSDTRNRSDLMGVPMNVTVPVIYNDTLNHLHDMRELHLDAMTKLNYLLAKHIVEYLNVVPTYLIRNTWGEPDPETKIFNGIIGDLQTGRAELAGGIAVLTTERMQTVDFVAHTTKTYMRAIFRAPPLSVVSNIFTLPFSIHVWYACYALLVIIFGVIFVIVMWEWNEKQFEELITDKRGVLMPTFLDVVQMEIGAIYQQGAEAEPKSMSGRIATFVVFLAFLFLFTSYSANIVALLQSTTDSINSVEGLLHSNIELGVLWTPYIKWYLENQKVDFHIKLYETKVAAKNNFMSVKEGVNKMRSEFFAFYGECDTIYKTISDTFLESEKCGLIEIDYIYFGFPLVPIRKKSKYKELVRNGYAKMVESGVVNRNFRRIYMKKPQCTNPGANFVNVSVNDVYFALLSYGIGLSTALMIFGIEYIFKKKKICRKDKNVVGVLPIRGATEKNIDT